MSTPWPLQCSQRLRPAELLDENDLLGQSVDGFANPVVQVSIVDFSNAVVTTSNDQVRTERHYRRISTAPQRCQANSGVASFTTVNASPDFQTGLTVGVEANETGVSLQASANAFDTNPVQATSTTFNVNDAPIPVVGMDRSRTEGRFQAEPPLSFYAVNAPRFACA